MVVIRTLLEQDSEISLLAKSSKKYWDYPDEWLQMWDEDLTITADYIKNNHVFHVSENQEILGFYGFEVAENRIILEYLFVHPKAIGKGIGKLLMNDFLLRAETFKINEIVLVADPHAEAFYERFGFKTVEMKPTRIEERFLPQMSKVL